MKKKIELFDVIMMVVKIMVALPLVGYGLIEAGYVRMMIEWRIKHAALASYNVLPTNGDIIITALATSIYFILAILVFVLTSTPVMNKIKGKLRKRRIV